MTRPALDFFFGGAGGNAPGTDEYACGVGEDPYAGAAP
jgi:hypothetical protein